MASVRVSSTLASSLTCISFHGAHKHRSTIVQHVTGATQLSGIWAIWSVCATANISHHTHKLRENAYAPTSSLPFCFLSFIIFLNVFRFRWFFLHFPPFSFCDRIRQQARHCGTCSSFFFFRVQVETATAQHTICTRYIRTVCYCYHCRHLQINKSIPTPKAQPRIPRSRVWLFVVPTNSFSLTVPINTIARIQFAFPSRKTFSPIFLLIRLTFFFFSVTTHINYIRQIFCAKHTKCPVL